MRFKTAFIFGAGFLTLCTAALALHFFYITPRDFAKYARLKELKKEVGKASSEQLSREVQKEMWIVSEGGRLHHQINSALSRLTFLPKGHHHEVIEKMEAIDGSMQERLGPKGETVRLFRAQKGLYHYGHNEFFADKVSLRLIDRPFPPFKSERTRTLLEGTAETMMLHFSERRPQIAVDQLKATLPGAS